MSKQAMFFKMVVQPGRGDELAAIYDGLWDHLGGEQGTEIYVLNRSSADPDTFFVYELFSSEEALNAHVTSPAISELRAFLTDAEVSREILAATPVHAVGTALSS